MSDPYCYAGTEILRNNPGVVDAAELASFEFRRSLARLLELSERPLQGGYDLAHLQAFHRHLFQDVYPWAGELRTVNISKGGSHFARVEYIRVAAGDIFEALAARDQLRGLTQREFIVRAAELLGNLNALHPFREGNGRTHRVFLGQLAGDAGWNIDWRPVTPAQNVEASIASMAGDNEPFEQILNRIVRQRDTM